MAQWQHRGFGMRSQHIEKENLDSFRLLMMRTAPFFIGYGCMNAWWQMIAANVLVMTPPPFQYFDYLFALLPPLVFICISGRVAPLVRRRYREVLYLFGFAGTFGTFTLYLVIGGAIDEQWLPAINALLGAAHICLLICWWERLSTLRLADIWAAVGCGIVVGSVISIVTAIIPTGIDSAVFCVLPLLSTALLQIRHRENTAPAGKGDRRNGEQTNADAAAGAQAGLSYVKCMLPAVPVLLIVVGGLTDIPSEALVVVEHNAHLADIGLLVIVLNTLQRMVVNLAAIACAYLAMRKNFALAFYLAVPLIAFAAFFLALDYEAVGVFHAISRIGSEMIHYIVLYLLFCVARERHVPALFCCSLMELLHHLGALLGLCFATTFAQSRVFLAIVFLFSLMAAMLLVLAAQQRGELVPGFPHGAGTSGANAERAALAAEPAAVEPAFPDTSAAMDAFAAYYGLTKRERDVMELWVKGHTTAFIGEQLSVSKHTVKTHVNHIYEKTGGNSKEGLILIFEQYLTSGDTSVK